MNEAFPRCAVPGSSCRLLQLEAPGARPVWAVLDAAGTRHFTGEITLHVVPTVRAWFNGGELYYAERDGDAPLAQRLLAMGVLTEADLAAGSVQLGAVAHLGRLFDRVPDLDRDRVELALEILTGEVVGEIADHVADDITIASYRHHSSGVVKWQKRPTVVISQVAAPDEPAPADATASRGTPDVDVPTALKRPAVAVATHGSADLAPTAEDAEIVAAFEAELAASLAAAVVEPTAPAAHDVPEPPPVPEPAQMPEPAESHEPAWDAPAAQPVGALDAVDPGTLDPGTLDPGTLDPGPIAPVTDEPMAVEPMAAPVAPVAPVLAPPVSEPILESPVLESPVLESPVLATESGGSDLPGLGGFELSFGDLRAELEAELRAQLGGAPEPFAEPIAEPVAEPVAEASPSAAEPTWQIDDRVDWQLEEPVAGNADAAITDASTLDAGAGGPVVEFDLDDILRQVNAGDPAYHRSNTPASTSGSDAGASDTDDEVRAAVRAALVEIEAATRSTGNDEIPSILMQAALADSEPGLAPSVDSWVQASLEQPAAPTPDAPIPTLSLRPVLPGVPPTLPNDPVIGTGGTDGTTGTDANDASGTPRPVDPPSQEMPSTGGLRRTIGIRKPT